MGSSPQVRGARERPRARRASPGIIPAGAGSTPACARGGSGSWDHPRRCGEHQEAVITTENIRGIIPAGAGSTCHARGPIAATEDHPRRCGEHSALVSSGRSSEGSSPQVRGALYTYILTILISGIIPAGAGSTRPGSPLLPLGGDHPRRCGEHKGAHHERSQLPGIIPAGAGSTASRS